MKKRILLIALSLLIFITLPYGNSAAAFALNLSTSLGNGWVIEGEGFAVYDMAADENYLYLVGTDSSMNRWRIEKRFLSNGNLVSSFGSNGVVLTRESAYGNASAYGIAIDGEYMYVVGFSRGYSAPCGYIQKRKLSDGSLVWERSEGVCLAIYYSVAIDSFYLYVAGGTWSTWYGRLVKARLEKRRLSDGEKVSSFATSGVLEYEWWSPAYNAFNKVMIDSDFIFLIGETKVSALIHQGKLMKVNANTGEKIYTDLGGTGGAVGPLNDFVMKDEYLYLAGYENLGSGDTQWRIWRAKKSDGRCATGFGQYFWECSVKSNPSPRADEAKAIAINGAYLYIAGYDSNTEAGDPQWRIERRYLANGDLDTAFGENGAITVNPRPGQAESPFAIVKKGNFIYVGGTPSWRVQSFLVGHLVYLPLIVKGQ